MLKFKLISVDYDQILFTSEKQKKLSPKNNCPVPKGYMNGKIDGQTCYFQSFIEGDVI